ncbi:MAG: divergent polysaccharide deacetylase family protein [Rhodospirillaceae bacterium]
MGVKTKPLVRLPFVIAGVVALVGFGAISGIAFDIATRPAPRPKPAVLGEAHASHAAPMPRVVAPATPSDGSFLDADVRRAWAPDPQAADPQGGSKQPPLMAFAVAVAPSDRPVLAIVIDDMGLDRPRALQMIALHGPLTLSLMTYADDLPGLVKQAHDAGHEVMAHLPMEPVNPKENPGRGALLGKMDDDAIRKQIAADLDGWSGYVGVNNHMGSKFTADKAHMAVVMAELKARGLMWLDSRTIADSAGPGAARAAGVPFITRDIFLDNVETVDAVRVQLELAKATAKSNGTAVAIGHPHDATIAALKEWLPSLQAAGVVLVPATEILRRRSERAPS